MDAPDLALSRATEAVGGAEPVGELRLGDMVRSLAQAALRSRGHVRAGREPRPRGRACGGRPLRSRSREGGLALSRSGVAGEPRVPPRDAALPRLGAIRRVDGRRRGPRVARLRARTVLCRHPHDGCRTDEHAAREPGGDQARVRDGRRRAWCAARATSCATSATTAACRCRSTAGPFTLGENLAATPGARRLPRRGVRGHPVHAFDAGDPVASGPGDPAADQQVLLHRSRSEAQLRRVRGQPRPPGVHDQLAQPGPRRGRVGHGHLCRRGAPRYRRGPRGQSERRRQRSSASARAGSSRRPSSATSRRSPTTSVNTASFGVTLLDFATPNTIGLFDTSPLVHMGRVRSSRAGVLDGHSLANVFTWLRPNDLVWNYWVNNYLLGNDPPTFDILAWNADPTNLPAQLHSQFLDIFTENLIASRGGIEVLGTPVDVGSVEVETYVTGATTDHLTPWKGCYRTTQLIGGPEHVHPQQRRAHREPRQPAGQPEGPLLRRPRARSRPRRLARGGGTADRAPGGSTGATGSASAREAAASTRPAGQSSPQAVIEPAPGLLRPRHRAGRLMNEPTVLWRPSPGVVEHANVTRFMRWLAEERGVHVADYDELWRWSVDSLEPFWEAVWQFYDVRASVPPRAVLSERRMPGARWFEGAQLNYAEHVLRFAGDDRTAIVVVREDDDDEEITWGELRGAVGAVAASLRDMGVERGDRVVAYLPNIPEAVIAMLAVTSLGAIWAACAPDFGTQSVVDRFAQLSPKVLFAADGYRFGGRVHDRRQAVSELRAALPTVEHTVLVGSNALPGTVRFSRPRGAGARAGVRPRPVRPSAVDPLLLGHDGDPEGHRPGPRRHPRRASEVARAVSRPPPRRSLLLLQLDELDGLELPRRRVAAWLDDRSVRGEPRLPRHRRSLEPRRTGRGHRARDGLRLCHGLPEGRCADRARARPACAAHRDPDRIAAAGERVAVAAPGARRAHADRLDLRRDGRVHGLHRREPATPGPRRRDCLSLAGRQGRGVFARRPVAGRPGRRVRHDRADALDAGHVLGRPGRPAATAGPTSRRSRGSGGRATGSRSRPAARWSSGAAPTPR